MYKQFILSVCRLVQCQPLFMVSTSVFTLWRKCSKFVGLSLVFALSACSSNQVDHTKTAECSQLNGRIVQPPVAQQLPGSSNFLNQYQQQNYQEAARVHAKKAKCID